MALGPSHAWPRCAGSLTPGTVFCPGNTATDRWRAIERLRDHLPASTLEPAASAARALCAIGPSLDSLPRAQSAPEAPSRPARPGRAVQSAPVKNTRLWPAPAASSAEMIEVICWCRELPVHLLPAHPSRIEGRLPGEAFNHEWLQRISKSDRSARVFPVWHEARRSSAVLTSQRLEIQQLWRAPVEQIAPNPIMHSPPLCDNARCKLVRPRTFDSAHRNLSADIPQRCTPPCSPAAIGMLPSAVARRSGPRVLSRSWFNPGHRRLDRPTPCHALSAAMLLRVA